MVRLYQAKDFESIAEWTKARGMKCPKVRDLSMHGYIAPEIAVGFLYRTDSSIAILDGYISNPKSDALDRRLALDEITERLMKDAKLLGYSILKCDTQLETIRERALRFGFTEIGEFTSFKREI